MQNIIIKGSRSFKVGLVALFLFLLSCSAQSKLNSVTNFVSGSFHWRTGHDESTVQLIPSAGANPIITENGKSFVHVKFYVKQYGEVSFPINKKTLEGEEALKTDLSKNSRIQLTYQSNHEFILQLRQTGVHGGVHNHITLSAAKKDTTVQIPFTEFKGGKTSLDLTDVAKFNFAFLSNNETDNYAELKISSFEIK